MLERPCQIHRASAHTVTPLTEIERLIGCCSLVCKVVGRADLKNLDRTISGVSA